jgi:hypothetical protein
MEFKSSCIQVFPRLHLNTLGVAVREERLMRTEGNSITSLAIYCYMREYSVQPDWHADNNWDRYKAQCLKARSESLII